MSAVLHERIVNLVLSFYRSASGQSYSSLLYQLCRGTRGLGDTTESVESTSSPAPASRTLRPPSRRFAYPRNTSSCALDVRTMPRRHYPPAPAAAIADARAPIAATSFRPPSAPFQLFSRRHNYTNPRRAIDHGRAMSVGSDDPPCIASLASRPRRLVSGSAIARSVLYQT